MQHEHQLKDTKRKEQHGIVPYRPSELPGEKECSFEFALRVAGQPVRLSPSPMELRCMVAAHTVSIALAAAAGRGQMPEALLSPYSYRLILHKLVCPSAPFSHVFDVYCSIWL